MTTLGTLTFRVFGETFELTRYANNHGRVYHVKSESIVVEGAEQAPGATAIRTACAHWLATGQATHYGGR